MDNAQYTVLTRQTGLMKEMRAVANNLANMSTTGYRREAVTYSEFIRALGPGRDSLSMGHAAVRITDRSQGALAKTGGAFDVAIEGPGYLLLQGPDGQYLTRAGSFQRAADGRMVTPGGDAVLDAGGAPVFLPPDGPPPSIAQDGTISVAGRAIGQIGLWAPGDPDGLERRDGVRFVSPGGVVPSGEPATLHQGFTETSNVSPVAEVTRMIEVQRAYELGQRLLDREDERIRSVIESIGR